MQDDRHFTFRSLEPLIIDLVLNDVGGDRVDLARVHARFLADKLDATPAPMVLSRLKLLAYYWGFGISMDAVAALEADIFCELYRVVCSASGSRQDRARAVQAIVRTHQQLTLNETRAAA